MFSSLSPAEDDIAPPPLTDPQQPPHDVRTQPQPGIPIPQLELRISLAGVLGSSRRRPRIARVPGPSTGCSGARAPRPPPKRPDSLNHAPYIDVTFENVSGQVFYCLSTTFDLRFNHNVYEVCDVSTGERIPFRRPAGMPNLNMAAIFSPGRWRTFYPGGSTTERVAIGRFFPGISRMPFGSEIRVRVGIDDCTMVLDEEGMESMKRERKLPERRWSCRIVQQDEGMLMKV